MKHVEGFVRSCAPPNSAIERTVQQRRFAPPLSQLLNFDRWAPHERHVR